MSRRVTSDRNTITHQIEFLKQVVVVMLGLALTNTLQNFIAEEWGKSFTQPSQREEIFVFIFLIFNLIRFFYGNWMSIDRVFNQKKFEDKAYFVNFIIVISQSIAFTFLSFYKQLYPYFFGIFAVVLLIDVLGFGFLCIKNPQKLKIQFRWLINNLVFAIILFSIIANQGSFFLAALVSSLNTIVGFAISWQFYLPVNSANNNCNF